MFVYQCQGVSQIPADVVNCFDRYDNASVVGFLEKKKKKKNEFVIYCFFFFGMCGRRESRSSEVLPHRKYVRPTY